MNTTMHATLIQYRPGRWHVKIEGETMCTRFAKTRSFRSEANARKEVRRMLGDDVLFNVVAF